MTNRKYNLKPAHPEHHGLLFGLEHFSVPTPALPEAFDIRTTSHCFPPVLDQGDLGCCAGNEVSNALRFCIGKEFGMQCEWQPSRLFVYYFGRSLDGSPLNEDTGMSINSAFESVKRYGVCKEDIWQYDITKFSQEPPADGLTVAKSHIPGFNYLSIQQDLVHLKQALVAGWPVVFGIQVYSSFESEEVAKTGVVPMPSADEEYLGGHCVLLCGYDDKTKTFICSNSWGTEWGQHGFFTLPYNFVSNKELSSQFYQARYFK